MKKKRRKERDGEEVRNLQEGARKVEESDHRELVDVLKGSVNEG